MLSSSGSSSAASKQRMLLPTSKGADKLEVESLNTVITVAGSLKSADRGESSPSNCGEFRWLI